jgi:hypothetical protein
VGGRERERERELGYSAPSDSNWHGNQPLLGGWLTGNWLRFCMGGSVIIRRLGMDLNGMTYM